MRAGGAYFFGLAWPINNAFETRQQHLHDPQTHSFFGPHVLAEAFIVKPYIMNKRLVRSPSGSS